MVEHPLVEPTTRIFALRSLALRGLAAPERIAQLFEDCNALVDAVDALPASLQEDYFSFKKTALMLKANAADLLAEQGAPMPEDLPERDRGKMPSDYWAEYLACRLPGGSPDPFEQLASLQHYALALAREGKVAEASEVYREVRERVLGLSTRMRDLRDDPVYSPVAWARWMSRFALALEGGVNRRFIEFLEAEEGLWPFAPDDWLANGYKIGRWYLRRGRGRPLVRRMASVIDAEPSERTRLLRHSGLDPASVYRDLSRACFLPDTYAPDEAIAWVLEAIREADDAVRAYVLGDVIRELLERQAQFGDVDLTILADLVQQYVRVRPDAADSLSYLERLDALLAAEATETGGIEQRP